MQLQSSLLDAILTTFLVGSISASLAVICGALVSLSCLMMGGRIGHVLLGLSGAFLFVPTYALAGAFSDGGNVNFWGSISPVATAQNQRYAIVAVAWIHTVAKLPLAVLIFTVATKQISLGRMEQTRLEGNWWSQIKNLWLPVLTPWIAVAWLSCFLLTHSDMVVSNLYQVQTLTELAYLNASLGKPDWRIDLASCSLSIAVVALIVTFIARNPSFQSASTASQSAWSWAGDRHWLRFAWAAPIVACVGPLVLLPLSNLILKTGFVPPQLNSPSDASFSFSQAVTALAEAPSLYSDEALWTLKLCGWSALIAVILSSIMLAIVERWAIMAWPVILLLMLIFALPGPSINQLAISTFNRSGSFWNLVYNDSLIPTIFCLQFRLLPIAFAMILPGWKAVQRRYESQWKLESFHKLGGPLPMFAHALKFPLGLAIIICVAIAAGELNCYLLVLPPGVTPLAMRIFELLHYAVRFRESALLLGIAMIGIVISFLFLRRVVLQ